MIAANKCRNFTASSTCNPQHPYLSLPVSTSSLSLLYFSVAIAFCLSLADHHSPLTTMADQKQSPGSTLPDTETEREDALPSDDPNRGAPQIGVALTTDDAISLQVPPLDPDSLHPEWRPRSSKSTLRKDQNIVDHEFDPKSSETEGPPTRSKGKEPRDESSRRSGTYTSSDRREGFHQFGPESRDTDFTLVNDSSSFSAS